MQNCIRLNRCVLYRSQRELILYAGAHDLLGVVATMSGGRESSVSIKFYTEHNFASLSSLMCADFCLNLWITYNCNKQ